MRLTKRQRDGLKAEKWVVSQLATRGYEARLISSWFDNLDIIVNGILGVEVKFRRPHLRKVRPGYYRPAWHFDVTKTVKGQDILLVLICEDEQGEWWPFLAPNHPFAWKRQGLMITSHPTKYRGMLAGCLNNWSNVDTVINRCYRYTSPQLSLWPEFSLIT